MEDWVAVTNLTAINIIFTEQLAIYTNCISANEAYNGSLQWGVKNLQGDFKKLKTEISDLKIQAKTETPAPLKSSRSNTHIQHIKGNRSPITQPCIEPHNVGDMLLSATHEKTLKQKVRATMKRQFQP